MKKIIKLIRKILNNIFFIKSLDSTQKLIVFCCLRIVIEKSIFLKLKYFYKCINKNKIVFCNFLGDSYACNPKYITKEILKQNLPYEIVWLVNDNQKAKNIFPNQIKIVDYNSSQAILEHLTAKLWIDNTRKNPLYKRGLYKRKKQKYIQTWHGALGIKKVEAGVSNLNHQYIELSKKDSKYIDYILSNSSFDDNMFKNDFWYDGEVVHTGHPRCDIFFKDNEEKNEIINKVKKILGIETDTHIILYVPTFRDDYSMDMYDIDYQNLLKIIEEKFGGKWVFANRLHPNLSNINYNYSNEVINVTDYPDVLELLVSADIVISDYSSCIFDFMFTKKPAFIYAKDIDKYNSTRGFYYPIESTPFPIATTNDELKNNIIEFDYNSYLFKLEQFLKENKCIEDGHSSERTVDLIKKIMEG